MAIVLSIHAFAKACKQLEAWVTIRKGHLHRKQLARTNFLKRYLGIFQISQFVGGMSKQCDNTEAQNNKLDIVNRVVRLW
jgi:hypothetical protein